LLPQRFDFSAKGSLNNNKLPKYYSLSSLFLLFIAFVLFWPSKDIGYFQDNCLSILEPTTASPLHYLNHTPPTIPYSYRPIHYTILLALQSRFGLNPIPVHMLVIPLHVLVCWLLFIFLVKSGFSLLEAILASLFMLVYQVNSAVILRVDNMNQPIGLIFGLLTLWFAKKAFFCLDEGNAESRRFVRPWPYIVSLITYAFALLSRETLLPFVMMIAILSMISTVGPKKRYFRLHVLILRMVPYAVLLMAYMAIRLSVVLDQPTFGPRLYDMNIGLNVLRNIFLYSLSLTLPVSTVDLFVAWKTQNILVLAGISIYLMSWIAFISLGVFYSKKRKLVLVLVIFAALASFPTILMNHISEQWSYTAVPFVATIIAIGANSLFMRYRRSPSKKILAGLFVALVLLSHTVGMNRKMHWLQQGNDLAISLRNQIARFLPQVRYGGEVWIINRPPGEIEYGHYLIRGTNVLCQVCIHKSVGRDDIRFSIMEPDEFQKIKHPKGSLVLKLEGDKLIKTDSDDDQNHS
jgi:hypothetical protein